MLRELIGEEMFINRNSVFRIFENPSVARRAGDTNNSFNIINLFYKF